MTPEPAAAGETSTVTSRDGTTLVYRQVGQGPGVVLVHGAMQAARNFGRLAAALATSFRVYVPNRRGRGGSGPFGEAYGLATEAEDLSALLTKTGARFVFGLSSGALIALYAARNVPGIDKLAIYEPPFTVDGADPGAWIPRYERDLARGDLGAAMATAIKGTGDVAPMTYVPHVVLAALFRVLMRADARRGGPEHIALRDLVPTVLYDTRLQREATALLPTLDELRSNVLLMGGDRSHPALRVALDAVARRLPRAMRVRFPRIGHVAADDSGRPLEVAEALRAFFGAGAH